MTPFPLNLISHLSHCSVHIKTSIIKCVKQLLLGSKTRPLVLKADSEATEDTCIASTSLATLERTGNLGLLSFHHESTSYSVPSINFGYSTLSFKYISSSSVFS
uniref:Uncharacterized protein n=1 Tax=Brassica oleracea var. oleracea TaxID=109376 RepID=A0A0D2ZZU4_BRAOL